MNRLFTTLPLVAGLFLFNGCAERKNYSPMPSISEDVKAHLDRRVNCTTAESDIQVLESERASTAKQILAGVRSVVPIAAATGLLLGDYRDRLQVATGEYNNALELKIEYIKKTCRIP